jgi:hypothetical protein
MSHVFLIELNHPNVPHQRLMIEAKGEASASKAYLEQVATLRKLSAPEALRLARENVPMLNGLES